MKKAYYSENNAFLAAWLRNLISAGEIAPGDVDERDIWDVKPDDLKGYTQCHFFAGLGIWSDVLRSAGWEDDRKAWTGSPPCQPFSEGGKGKGFADERHLWPAMYHLIDVCRPVVFFGEQVANGAGPVWLDLVYSDLEAANYSIGPLDLCSAGFGAPNVRQRFGFVAHSNDSQWRTAKSRRNFRDRQETGWVESDRYFAKRGENGVVRGFWRGAEWLDFSDGKRRPVEPGTFPLVARYSTVVEELRAYGNSINRETWTAFVAAYMEEAASRGNDL